MGQTPPPPRATPEPRPAPRPPEAEPLPENIQNLVNQVERAVGSSDPFLMIFQLHRFANARPEGMPGEIWTDLYINLKQALGNQLGVSANDIGVDSLPLLEAYRQTFAGAQNIQLGLSAGNTPEAMLEQGAEWIQNYDQFTRALGRNAGSPLARRLLSFLRAPGPGGESMSESFNTLIGTFQAAGVSITPPAVPPDPSAVEGALGLGDFGPSAGGGGFTPSRSIVTEEPRPPTAEEFLNDFDNAFLAFLGQKVEEMSATQVATVRERRNELLGQYIQRLAEFTEGGESPFLGSTRFGEVTSETATAQPGGVGGEIVSRTTRFGVEVPTDIGINFLTAKVTPTAFLTNLFPTTTAFRNFAVGPQPEKSPIAREGFAAGTKFQENR